MNPTDQRFQERVEELHHQAKACATEIGEVIERHYPDAGRDASQAYAAFLPLTDNLAVLLALFLRNAGDDIFEARFVDAMARIEKVAREIAAEQAKAEAK